MFNPLDKSLSGQVVDTGLVYNKAVELRLLTSVRGKKWWQSLAKLMQNRPRAFFIQKIDQTVSNSVVETTILGTGVSSITLPADYFDVGKTIRMKIGGVYSTPVLGATLTFKVKLGAVVIATVVTTSLFAGAVNLEFDTDLLITCRTKGVAGTVLVHGDVKYATGVAGTIAVDPLNNAGAATVVNTTVANTLNVTVTWDAATATRSIKSTVALIEEVQ